MNPTDPLANLRDIHLPEAISWWPLALGWWILIALLSIASIFACMALFKHHQTRLYRRQAMQHLREIENLQGQKQLIELFELLKRTAICAYPNQSPANLSPKAFVAFLIDTCKEPIFNHIPDDLETVLYAKQAKIKPVSEDFISSAMVWAKVWIEKHPQSTSRENLPPC